MDITVCNSTLHTWQNCITYRSYFQCLSFHIRRHFLVLRSKFWNLVTSIDFWENWSSKDSKHMHTIKTQCLGQIQKTWKMDEEITYSHHNIVSKHMRWPKDPKDIIQKQSTQHCCCCCKTAPQQIIFRTQDVFRFHVPEIRVKNNYGNHAC